MWLEVWNLTVNDVGNPSCKAAINTNNVSTGCPFVFFSMVCVVPIFQHTNSTLQQLSVMHAPVFVFLSLRVPLSVFFIYHSTICAISCPCSDLLLLGYQSALTCSTHPTIQHMHLDLMHMFPHLDNSSLLQHLFQGHRLSMWDTVVLQESHLIM
jgi:hypothetical protein